jgi:hypothetical protein
LPHGYALAGSTAQSPTMPEERDPEARWPFVLRMWQVLAADIPVPVV